jgi:hypothetical protein
MSEDVRLALFLGAGFSKWAADLPVARQVFDYGFVVWGQREKSKLNIVKSLKENWDREHADGEAEQFIADALSFPERDRQAVIWYLVRRLSEPFIWREYQSGRTRRHTLMIDEDRRFKIEGVVKASGLLNRFRSILLTGIVTTNYDMLIEYALGTNAFNYGLPNQTLTGRGPYPVSTWMNPVRLTGCLPLAKIHGSVSWDENGYYTDGRRGLTGNALVVAPTPEKKPPESLEFHWEIARQILENSTRLVVFGFAFNPYDTAVLDLLKSAGQNLESVLLIDIAPQLGRASHLWPNAIITACPPPPDGVTQVRNWAAEWLGKRYAS